ncbi:MULTISPECIES: pseudouridine synthase [unclassified Leptolyngbya]|uniref:pseudouridine synthase n=1 Tax=unclassified Leptolyngbya TaxID=2650499 RepID=UPI0016887353|nr:MULTISPECIES: pseudouridine synthase [unclassified Leptolyngbya]MBD1913304.1 rRNA pseudouridine synthase [Leptolyngbya sp. FACHB-8]MBD2155350.1 rRNA pseudouridine synthase [Leptolyngbya sp. FACHB-16]
MTERLQKILSQWGIASRRQAEQMIVDGRVQVNGDRATLGQKVDPERDHIEVDGQPLQTEARPEPLYLLLNKPAGIVTTCRDSHQRRTVLDLIPEQWRSHSGLHPVGRLDAESTGALLLTNDGELTFALTHPSHEVAKTYLVWVKGHPSERILEQWRRGILLDGRKTLPAQVKRLRTSPQSTQLEIVLREGRNRQIRRVAEQLGYPVQKLHRVAIGSIQIGDLAKGNVRSLHPSEVRYLQDQAKVLVTKSSDLTG